MRKYNNISHDDDKCQYLNAHRDYKHMLEVKKKSYFLSVSDNINSSLRDSSKFWNLLRGMNRTG